MQNQVPGEEFPTTNEDLAGFWDMVMLQVVQVNDIFAHIDELKNSQWQEVRPSASMPSKRRKVRKKIVGDSPKKKIESVERSKPPPVQPSRESTQLEPDTIDLSRLSYDTEQSWSSPQSVLVVQHCVPILPPSPIVKLEIQKSLDDESEKILFLKSLNDRSRRSRGITSIATSPSREPSLSAIKTCNQLRSRRGCIEKPKHLRGMFKKIIINPELKKIINHLTSQKSSGKKTKNVTFDADEDKIFEDLKFQSIDYSSGEEIVFPYVNRWNERDIVRKPRKSVGTQNDSGATKAAARSFSRVTDVWSNLQEFSADHANDSSSVSVASQCPAWRKLNKKKAVKDLRKRKLDDNVEVETKRSEVIWTQSDSQPFIPMSKETVARLASGPRNAKRCFELLSPTGTSKLDRMKKYDSSRKKNLEDSRARKHSQSSHPRQTGFSFPDKSHRDFTVRYFLSPPIIDSEGFAKIAGKDDIFGREDIRKVVGVKSKYFLRFEREELPAESRESRMSREIVLKPKNLACSKTSPKIKNFCTFVKFNRTFCRLSLYLYVYGMLSVVLVLLKLTTCKRYFFETRFQ